MCHIQKLAFGWIGCYVVKLVPAENTRTKQWKYKVHTTRNAESRFYWWISETYHLEAINSDPMLGFFSKPIKIYFLIWSVAHFMSRYRRVCGSNGGHRCSFRVDQLVCRFSTFFSAHQENQTILFLELLVQYQACRLLKSSIAGKHFFVSKQAWKSFCLEI